jgi:hypothetical protein
MTPLVLTTKEKALITYIRAMGYGSLKVVVVDMQPDRVEEILKSTKF